MFDESWWLCALALFAGCTVQTAVGFGMALVAAPIIVMLNPTWVPYVLAVTALVLSIQNTWNQRRSVQWKQVIPPMITRIPGTILGTWILLVIAVQSLQILVAAMVLLTVVVSVWLKPFPSTPVNTGIAGFVSGITGTTTSIGGPPMALVMQHGASHNVRANLSAYFIYSCLVSLIGYALVGLMPATMWLVSASMIPVAYSGFFVGKYLRPWVDNRFRPILLILCGLSASVAIINAILSS